MNEYHIVINAMSHFKAIEHLKRTIFSNERTISKVLTNFDMTTKTRGEDLLFEWVARAVTSRMSVKAATKHVKIADYYFKFGECFPALPLLQPIGSHDK